MRAYDAPIHDVKGREVASIHTPMHFLRHLFGVFLKSRRTRHLFRSRFLFESLPTEKAARVLPETLARSLPRDACDDLDTVLARLKSRKNGLSHAEATAIRRRTGPNEINHEKPMPWLLHLWLSLLALVSWITADLRAATVIGSMVTLSTVMRFAQERHSNRNQHPLTTTCRAQLTFRKRATSLPASSINTSWSRSKRALRVISSALKNKSSCDPGILRHARPVDASGPRRRVPKPTSAGPRKRLHPPVPVT